MNVSEVITSMSCEPVYTTTIENDTPLVVGETIIQTEGLKESRSSTHSKGLEIGNRNVEKINTTNTQLSIPVNPDNDTEQLAKNEYLSSIRINSDDIVEAKVDAEKCMFDNFSPVYKGSIDFLDGEEEGIYDCIHNMRIRMEDELCRLRSGKYINTKRRIPTFIARLYRMSILPCSQLTDKLDLPVYYLASALSRHDEYPLSNNEKIVLTKFSNMYDRDCFFKKQKGFINIIKTFLINLLAEHYYNKVIYSMNDGDFISMKAILSKLNMYVVKYNTDKTQAFNKEIPLLNFHLEHLKGNFDKSIKYLYKSVDDKSIQGLFNKSVIQFGLCDSYICHTDIEKAFENMQDLSRKVQNPKNIDVSEKKLGIHELIPFLWQNFRQETTRCDDYKQARDACFKMIASYPKAIDTKESLGWLTVLNKDFIDKVIPKFISDLLYPYSEEGLSLWNKLKIFIRSRQLCSGYVAMDDITLDLFVKLLNDSVIDKDKIPSIDHLDTVEMIRQLGPLVKTNYEFIVNYIHWAKICKHKIRDKDETKNNNEKKQTIKDMINFATFNPDLPESIINVRSGVEWGVESLAALFGFKFLMSGNDQPNHKKAKFLAEMCLLSSKNSLPKNSYSNSQHYTSDEESRQAIGDTTASNNTTSAMHRIIIKAVCLIECGEHEQAIHDLQAFNKDNISGVVECMLGYIKERQLNDFSGDKYQTALQEVITHYKNAADQNILSASKKVTRLVKIRTDIAKKHAKLQRLGKKNDHNPTTRSPSALPLISIDPDDISNSSSEHDDNINEKKHQTNPLIKEQEQEQEKNAWTMQRHNRASKKHTKIKEVTTMPLSIAINQYCNATSDNDNIDFENARRAITDMEKNINSITFEVDLSTELQVKQYEAWYNYQLQREYAKMRRGNDVIDECKQCFYQSLKKGFQLINCDIVPENPTLSIARIRESVIKYRISANTQAEEIKHFDTQVASMASTWGHYYSEFYPNKNLHHDFYKLAEFLKPSKADTHQSWKPLKKLTLVDDISSLRPV